MSACVLSLSEALLNVVELYRPYLAAEAVDEVEESAGRVSSGALRCVRLACAQPQDALPELLDEHDADPHRKVACSGRVQ